MLNEMRPRLISKILFYLFSLFIPSFFLESSLINPDLTPKLLGHTEYAAGYEDFAKGRAYFNEENWEEAIYFFTQAVKKSYKPDAFECNNYFDDEGYRFPCEDYDEDIEGYTIREVDYEIMLSIYRHSHFYLGLSRLYQKEIPKANLHFKKAIGFDGIEDNLGLNFYKCANIIHPSWIAFAALTRLQVGKDEEAQALMEMALWTVENLEDLLDWRGGRRWDGSVVSEYWKDLRKRGVTDEKWIRTQWIISLNTASFIASIRNNLKSAIGFASDAIWKKDYAIKEEKIFGESEEHFILYHNRGVLYSQSGLYQEALADLTKAIELNRTAESYFHRGNVYLILEEYSEALADYQQAILLDPSNPKYYRQRALAYAIMGSIDKAKQDLILVKEQNIKLKAYQNELGLHEFSKGSFEKAIDHFNQFIEFQPHLAIGYQNRGAALYQAGKLKEAIRDYSEAIRLDPTRADLYQMRAVVLMSLPALNEKEKRAYFMEAQNNLLSALELNPTDAKIYQNLAASSSLGGNLKVALDFYQKALELASSQDHPRLLKKLSSLHFELGEYEHALLNCEKAIQLGCKEGEIYFIQGCCLFETNQTEQALQKYDLAIHAGYNDPKVYFHRAKAYFCLHQLDKALEDATRVIKTDADNAECYKLRGLIFLSRHQDLEAYTDFRMALRVITIDSPINDSDNQSNNPILKLNAAGTMFQSGRLITSLDGLSIYKPLLQSEFTFDEKSFLKKMGEIQFDAFGRGLAAGLIDGGAETFKELGPFLANVLFHPIETTEEVLTAIQLLFSKALEEEWETLFEALAPELKELFFKWDQIEDYHKGRLTGRFIGKNGIAALTALGAVKTCSKLKNVIIGSYKTKFSCLLKRTKPEVLALPASEFPLPPGPKERGWRLLYPGGEIIKSEFHHEQALVRISPDFAQQRLILEERAIKKSHELGASFTTWEEFENLTITEASQSLSVESRVIPSSVVEAEIANTGSKDGKLKVVFNEKEEITLVKCGQVFVRNKNTKDHIMQPKHNWDKLIEISGKAEEDCEKVIQLLEENKIYLEKYRLDPIDGQNYQKFVRYDHQMTIKGYEVVAIFNKNLETGEKFLNDAWVIIK